tara:strand:+ start:1260 stop:3038 length:1779 start_codon:yes stop_codon:yes gene_type:complete
MNKTSRKLRILWCGEASFLNTGYSIYAKEVLTRLYETEKYEIAELACYAAHDNPSLKDVPWRVYPNLPINDMEQSEYSLNQSYQFGENKFDYVCLDFRPDVVIDIRDWWMMEYQDRSALRKFYKWVIMPTVDSKPQQEQFMNSYLKADAVFTYSEFGKEVLEEQSNNHIQITDIASPGADFNKLKPVSNKNQHRAAFGFSENINIFGTVMRNQRRKLYPNLIESFKKMIDSNPELSQNTFLYLHTSYPDLGWELPYFIRLYNMGNHVLLTYKCRNCGYFFPSFYQDSVCVCPRCNNKTCHLPNTSFGVTTEELSHVINFFDLYIQYSVCEGFGMPQVEAAACGVPVITVNYSAMESVGKNIKADFIDVESFFWDSPTHSQRAIPNDGQLVEKMTKFAKLPKSMKNKKGMDAYMGAKKNYTWEKCSKKWEEYLDSIEIIDHSLTWDSDANLHNPNVEIPENIASNKEFIDWAVTNIWGQPENKNTYTAMRMLRDLNNGKTLSSSEGIYYNELSYIGNQANQAPYTAQDAANQLKSLCDSYNNIELIRESVSKSCAGVDSLALSNYGYVDINSIQDPRCEFLSTAKPDNRHIIK